MPIKKNTNKLSQLYRTIDQKELSKEALDTLAKLRLATGNFRKQEGKEVDAFKLFFDRLIKNKPTAVKTTPEYKAMIKERRSENGRKAMEARKAKQESRQGQGSEEDAKRPAKPFGWRLKGKHNYRKPTRADISSGKAYYEARINRADSKRTKFPMLERGGYMADGGVVYYVNDFYPNYDEDKIAQILKDNGFKKVRKGKKYGYSNQPVVVMFEGNKNTATDILEKEFENYISVYEKDWGRKMADGGAIENQYEGRTPESIWDSLSAEQRYHFIYDHLEQIEGLIGREVSGTEMRTFWKSNWSDLDEDVKNRFANHVREGQYADGGFMAKGGDIVRNLNKNSYMDMFNFYLDNNETPVSKGNLIKMAYGNNTTGIDSAIPQSMVGDVDNTSFYVYDYQTNKFGELVDLRKKLQFSNVPVALTIVLDGKLIYGDDLMDELRNITFNRALNYVFKNKGISNFDIRPISNSGMMADGGFMAKGGVFYSDSHKLGHE